jgi:taurine dioxygenase
MTFSVEPLSPQLSFGKVVRGLTGGDLDDAGVCDRLRGLWTESGLLMFRAGDATVDFHLKLSRVFGPLEVHRTREFRDARYPELLTLSSASDDTEIQVDDESGGQFQSWHKDLIYADKVNRGGILRAIKPSGRGGLTGFLDLADAYDRLPDALKRRIEGLRVVYRMSLHDEAPYYTPHRLRILRLSDQLAALFSRRERDYPPVSHPLLFVDPASGRNILNFSPGHAMYVEGLPAAESHALLSAISAHVFACPAYHHQWSTDEMVLFDNWRMLHMVSLIPRDQERVMQRTTIAGDYGLGRIATNTEGRLPALAR